MIKHPQGIQSVEIAFGVIDVFLRAGRPLGLGEASGMLGMPKSKLHKYLVTLVKLGVLRQDPENSRYGLGSKLLESGLSILRGLDLPALCEPELSELRDHSGQAAALSLWLPNGPMIVRYLRSFRPISIDMQVGFYAPVTSSAVGKCFAAYLPEQAFAPLLLAETGTPAPDDAFRAELRQVRACGFAIRETPNATIPGSKALACPVFDVAGKIAASLLLIGFDDAPPPFPAPDMVALLRESALRVSINLGFREQPAAAL